MSKTLRTKSSNLNIISLMVIISLFIFSMSGCQQINDAVNGNKATNTNTTANSNTTANTNANSNANSNVTANSNANANSSASPTNSAANANTQASNTAANTATAPKEEVPLTPEAKVFKNNLVGEWIDNYNNKHKFTEDTYELNIGSDRYQKGSYKVVSENNIEFVNNANGKNGKATMKIEGDGNTLIWIEDGTEYKFKRVNPK